MAAISVILRRIYGPDDTVKWKKKKEMAKLKGCSISMLWMPLCFINRNLWQILAIRADQIAGSIIKYYESTAIRNFIFRCLQCQEEIKSDKKNTQSTNWKEKEK